MEAARGDDREPHDLVRRLRRGLARFDDHRATQYAEGGGHLSGYTRGQWEEAQQQVEQAREVLRRHERSNDRPDEDARRALAQATDDVDAALDLAARIDTTRAGLVHRANDIVDRANGIGATEVAETAGELSDRASRDPLGGAHERDLRSTEVDLAVAELSARLDECRSAAATATELVEEATKDVDGFSSPPLPDLTPSARSLAQLRAAAASDDADPRDLRHEATLLTDDLALALTQILAVVKTAGEAVDRRNDLRGWLRVLTRRAAVLGLSTDRHVAQAREQLDVLVWSVGCDHDDVERLLVRLTRMLDPEGAPDA
jgi:hypothetical protein